MKVQLMKMAEIRPYEGNPRTNEKAIQVVAESIRQFGWRQPIVVDRDEEDSGRRCEDGCLGEHRLVRLTGGERLGAHREVVGEQAPGSRIIGGKRHEGDHAPSVSRGGDRLVWRHDSRR